MEQRRRDFAPDPRKLAPTIHLILRRTFRSVSKNGRHAKHQLAILSDAHFHTLLRIRQRFRPGSTTGRELKRAPAGQHLTTLPFSNHKQNSQEPELPISAVVESPVSG
ncbi:hypothetical protein SIAM614_23357 [Stappia aggregata IAM 12614]|uniref:Uncharacterized protein n=1 Tax=Roseibium aggregatum (strain ATCC 25650 / DSM 13394 / JCM 20685 / NBRC 16684 / NCIMB 2208 / IAM 12614 / B1) TaxID=384765 RepID=A0NN78_ROSAI|nr:hypothetical protein SIAM614_23357 [Stappia aggregata IAM 12614] [Roseibium aggregatum IAM 12614]